MRCHNFNGWEVCEKFYNTMGCIPHYHFIKSTKSKEEKERYIHLNAEFQRIARRESLPQWSMQRNRGKQQNGKD